MPAVQQNESFGAEPATYGDVEIATRRLFSETQETIVLPKTPGNWYIACLYFLATAKSDYNSFSAQPGEFPD